MSSNTTAADLPQVHLDAGGNIVVALSPDHAEVLAKVLAQFDSSVSQHIIEPHTEYEAEVWHHTLILLLSEHAKHQVRVADLVEFKAGVERVLPPPSGLTGVAGYLAGGPTTGRRVRGR